ncbi:MAG TPA: NTP transferase domain-containing protein [Acidimicrobiia bacterium]|nr:NTP transferase domain-containing protein [Acidimicrobiia bacterium]
MPRLIAVVQARTGSTRLPRKVLRDLGGRPVLAWVVAAARDSRVCDEIVVATTTSPDDDAVATLATELRAHVVRGPVDDVLTRYLMAIDAVGGAPGDAVIRLTADCPLLDPHVIALCGNRFVPDRVDYVTTDHDFTVAHGFDVEVVSVDTLRRIDAVATGADRAHVTSYVTFRPDEFRVATVALDPSSVDLRVTLDEPADAELLDAIVDELGDRANDWREVVALLRARPDLVAINAHVDVKPLAAG